jgi:hypothetical protein
MASRAAPAAWHDALGISSRRGTLGSLQHCVEQRLEITWPPTDMPWNVREMRVRHPDGRVFRISRGIGEE